MNSIDYNVFNLSLENGLNNHAISSGKDYIILLKSPVGANVQVRLNSNQGDLIPLKENYAIKAKDIKEIFISADIVPGGTITIGQSNSVEGFEIITAPTVNEIEEIGKINSFDTALLDKLDKIINPFELQEEHLIVQETNSSTIVFNKLINSDKVSFDIALSSRAITSWQEIYIFIDDIVVRQVRHYSNNGYTLNSIFDSFCFEQIKNKTLKVFFYGTQCYGSLIIKEFTKKV